MGVEVSLENWFNKFNSAEAGLVEFEGVATVPWTGEQALEYEIENEENDNEGSVFINMTTNKVQWIYGESGMVCELLDGFNVEEFSSDFFTLTATACENAPVLPATNSLASSILFGYAF